MKRYQKCDVCHDCVDTEENPNSQYTPGYNCLCGWCEEEVLQARHNKEQNQCTQTQ